MAESSNPPTPRSTSIATSPPRPLSSLRENQKPPVGLYNFQNTCYLNSVLQCLTFTPPLAEYCLTQLHSTSCPCREKGDCTFCILEEQICKSLRLLKKKVDAPEKLYMRMLSYSENFQPENQGDAHELLRFLITDCGKGFQAQNQQQPAVLEGLFGSVLQNHIKCQQCGSESTKHDPILDVCLDISDSRSLAQAFAGFFRPEVLDGDNKYHCESCNEFSAAEMRMSIDRAPKVLTIQLKRFNVDSGLKVTHLVRFETKLCVAEYMSKNHTPPEDSQYSLYAVIVHTGRSLARGHYYTFVKDTNGKWYQCEDESVRRVTEDRVLAANAYLLFYIRSDITVSESE